jgi:CheY-like chemotaxis protein
MIRAFEQENNPPVSKRASAYGRLPIIAVSASLVEQNREEYIECGFDGWMLKPIDFKRLEEILATVEYEKGRKELLYGNGNVVWGMGGWFRLRGV